MIVNRSKRVNRRKQKKADKKATLVLVPFLLVVTLVFSNVAVSAKTYTLINCNRELDSLNTEFKDLNEQKEVLISPVRVRERAIKDLGMVDIENIDELLLIQP